MFVTRLLPCVLVIALLLVLSTANKDPSLKKKLETEFPKADMNKNGKVCVSEYTAFMTPKIIEYYKKEKLCVMEVRN